MLGNPIVVRMIERNIDKIIREIDRNPARGLQSLARLAQRYAKTPLQKELLGSLDAKDNMIVSLVNNVDHLTIKTFIMNMAYNSLSYGAKITKNIPWVITFDFTDESLDNNMVINIIEQGKKLGIYTYMFFTDNIANYSDVLRQNPDCAFILYVPTEVITSGDISKIKSYNNMFISVLHDPAYMMDFEKATNILYSNKFLYGVHSYFSDENIDYILSGNWASDIVSSKSPFGILIRSIDSNLVNASLIHNYVNSYRLNPQSPLILIDLYEDIRQVNIQLEAPPCIFKIMGSGQVSCNGSALPNNIKGMTLLEAFEMIK